MWWTNIINTNSFNFSIECVTRLLWLFFMFYFQFVNLTFYLFVLWFVNEVLFWWFYLWLLMVCLFNRFDSVCSIFRIIFEWHGHLISILRMIRIIIIIDQIQTRLRHKYRRRIALTLLNLAIHSTLPNSIAPRPDILLIYRLRYVLYSFLLKWCSALILTWTYDLIGTSCTESVFGKLYGLRYLFDSINEFGVLDFSAVSCVGFEYLFLLGLMNL